MLWKISCVIGFLTLVSVFRYTDATACYQCDSWEHPDCNEDDYIDEKYLVPCSFQYQQTPTTCRKEVTTFLPGQIQSQLDRYNRFGRPHVARRCGISLSSSQVISGSSNYRPGDYYEGCSDEGGEVTVNGIQAIRLTCTCLTDGCNSALPSGMISMTTLIGTMTLAFASSYLLF